MSLINRQSNYSKDELISSGHGTLFGEGFARLPLPPMLMVNRIKQIAKEGGAFGKGLVEAEMDVTDDQWFFSCHFESDPVMPGCLGLDAMWQLVGFFLAWSGAKGKGRALGVGEVKFSGQIMPTAKLIRYQIDMKKSFLKGPVLGIGDGQVWVDGELFYQAKGLRVGLFTDQQLSKS